ncbi:unnamed protein product [Pleuronectes platessa]|uniref:KIND domain-containing protein n=1 Tax=Pleuronectes platessa TaxID=8262 RepID=A0A9N7UAI9_PLEPL|nr:unnamed protein product [Pleuronectes platessa]
MARSSSRSSGDGEPRGPGPAERPEPRELSLEEVLKCYDQPINEEQAWAVCYQSCRGLPVPPPPTGTGTGKEPSSILLHRDGTVCLQREPRGHVNFSTGGEVGFMLDIGQMIHSGTINKFLLSSHLTNWTVLEFSDKVSSPQPPTHHSVPGSSHRPLLPSPPSSPPVLCCTIDANKDDSYYTGLFRRLQSVAGRILRSPLVVCAAEFSLHLIDIRIFMSWAREPCSRSVIQHRGHFRSNLRLKKAISVSESPSAKSREKDD